METTATAETPVVVRIGAMGAKTHLGFDHPVRARLFPACGNDSPFKPSRKLDWKKLSDITCIKCRKKAIALGLI